MPVPASTAIITFYRQIYPLPSSATKGILDSTLRTRSNSSIELVLFITARGGRMHPGTPSLSPYQVLTVPGIRQFC